MAAQTRDTPFAVSSERMDKVSHTHFCHLRVASSSVECKMTTSAGTVITSSIFLQKIFYRIKLIDQWQGRQERGAKGAVCPKHPL